ncbi:hypothetical protein I3F58_05835 [Streptomyces sp. MUM 203J]|uniref:hypothetical protein n=1 Tax=Streptomyces sp. MUM 203J TaxID=2791990 RepID=UPI001F0431DC|nr:hypothetical protein [Streptomyces sp. MUM 203J]MCH0539084.1 hypothetical protein [Streptomyces sp. MUM 203J]
MEGLPLIRGARPARLSRPMALVSAVATLLATLFLCLAPAQHTDGGGRSAARAGAPGEVPAGVTLVAGAEAAAGAGARPFAGLGSERFGCPLDDRGCGLFPSLTPAVLTAPPLDSPLPADTVAARGQVAGPVALPCARALPRAPDLHVLQVLRT